MRCDRQVVSLYEQTDGEVLETLRGATEGGVCVHTRRTADGALVTRTTRRQQLVEALAALAEQRRGQR